jgi:hypothetical protein
MGRPVAGPMSTFPHPLKEAILHLRQLHPGWGPATLLTALKTDGFWQDQPMIDTLPVSISNALLEWLYAYYGVNLASLEKDTPL